MRYESDVISKNIKRNQKIKKILCIILYIMLIPIILFSILLFVLELGDKDEFPSSLNIELYTISSDSMKPRLNINDVVIVKKGYESSQYKKGNIITFIREDGEIITHRIERIVERNSVKYYITKGDNNELEDEYTITDNDIIGKVIYTMPKLGLFMKLLKNKLFFAFCIFCLILIIIIDNNNRKKKLERKEIRKKYESKPDFYF
jgi:signal peptidase